LRRTAIPQILGFCFICLAQASLASAQTANPSQPLKLDAAVELALTNYPAIKTAQAQAAAAKAQIDLARTAYLPRLDLLYQERVRRCAAAVDHSQHFRASVGEHFI